MESPQNHFKEENLMFIHWKLNFLEMIKMSVLKKITVIFNHVKHVGDLSQV